MNLSEDGTRKVDPVVESLFLASAEQLAKWCGLPLETHAGRASVRLDARPIASLAFDPALRDMRPYNRIVAVLSTAGAPVSPSLEIELSTRTEGLIDDDSFDSGASTAVAFENSWGEYLFPWENLLVFGMGALVYPARKIKLHFRSADTTAAVWIAELRIDRRDRAAGPRLTDLGLKSVLSDCDGPGLLAHLRRRERPRHAFAQRIPEGPAAAATFETADTICRHIIAGYAVGDPVNWRLNPNGYLEWMHAFNRHGWMNALLNAYHASGDTRYVRKLDELWLSWLQSNPEPVGHNGGGDPAWETLSTAIRILCFWLRAFFLLLDDPNFRDTTRIEILKSLHGHAEHLLAYKGHSNNWLIVESQALFTLGLLFPEFRRAADWQREGATRLEQELARQVWPDGADWEISPGYHVMACRGFVEALALARLNDVSLPPLFDERLPATFDYVAGMTRPDGTQASLNDSGGWRNQNAGAADYLQSGASLFNRPDWLQGPEGPYAGVSRIFPDAGQHVLASGTGPQALWSLLDGGPPGAAHCHEDALNVEFFAFGKPFIVDPGITGYMHDDWTAYYRRTASHNTVLVNGAGQMWATQAHAERTVSARGRTWCGRGDIVDAVRAVYDRPYYGQPDGLTHARTLLFVRERYWILFDEIAGGAAMEMEARFQFVPLRLILDRRRRTFRTIRQNLPNLELRPLTLSGRMKLSITTGATVPVGGWVSDGEDQPAPQARIGLYRREPDIPLRLVTIVYPFAQGVGSGLKLRLQPHPALPQAVRLSLRHADGTRDTVDYDWDPTAWRSPAATFELPVSGRIGTRAWRLDARQHAEPNA